MATEAAVDLIFKAIFALVFLGILVWGFKQYLTKIGETPRAPCGYMTLKDLDQRCEVCLDRIQEKIDGVFDRVKDRLENGDKLFDQHAAHLQTIDRRMIALAKMLKGIQTGLQKDRKLIKEVRDLVNGAKK